MRLSSCLTLYIQINSESVSNPTVRVKTINLLEENKDKSHDLGFDSGFLEKHKKLEQQKSYKQIPSKLETCASKGIVEK